MNDVYSAKRTLKVLGILSIVLGAFGLITGVTSFVTGGFLAGELATPGAISPDEVEMATTTTGLVFVAGIILIIAGIVTLLQGIFSVRAANDSTKIGPAYAFAIVGLVFAVIDLVLTFVGGANFSSIIDSVCSIVVSGVLFWACKTIKEHA